MRIKTGETVTASLLVDVQYICSSCGNYNLSTQTIKASAHTAAIMGINLDNDVFSKAQQNMQDKIVNILDQNNPERFRLAAFSCSCKHCGHTEPWAQTDNKRINIFRTTSLVFVICCGIFFLITLLETYAIGRSLIFLALHFISAALFTFITIRRHKNMQKIDKLIKALPPKSLPVVLPYVKERHNL